MLNRISNFLHHNFLFILIAAYFLAAFVPEPGLFLRSIALPPFQMFGTQVHYTLSMMMLSLLLFNAGIGVKTEELRGLARKPSVLFAGFTTNLLLPVVLVIVCRPLFGLWHSGDEIQNVLMGLALIAAMPIAGSSTAWAQNAEGNLSLSLGLVFFSTLLSPVTTPAVLRTFGWMTNGDYSEDLNELAYQGTNVFMGLTVVTPSILGMICRFAFGDERLDAVKPKLKLVNMVLLLLLNYSNASTSLPNMVRRPDWDFLLLVGAVTLTLCITAFGAGWLLSRMFKTGEAEKASLMFGLGMNNNGTGLVLASLTLADHPAVMLPMIFYTLSQQIIAAVIDRLFFNGPIPPAAAANKMPAKVH